MQHYYVAVGHRSSKLLTLVDLLVALSLQETSTALSLAICCSSRDSLDEALVSLQEADCELACLHADMAERELCTVVRAFQLAASEAGEAGLLTAVSPQDGAHNELFTHPDDAREQQLLLKLQMVPVSCKSKIRVLVVTDAALKMLPQSLSSIGMQLIIHLDLPPSRELHHRRVAALAGAPGTATHNRAAVYFVVAGQIAEFRALEKFANAAIHEMPVHIADILAK